MYSKLIYRTSDINLFKKKLLTWGARYDVCCYLDNNAYPNHPYAYSNFETKMAVGVKKELLPAKEQNAFKQLHEFTKKNNSWLFGFLTYELKDHIENLTSHNRDGIQLPLLYFFEPCIIITIKNNAEICIEYNQPSNTASKIYNDIIQITPITTPGFNEISISCRVPTTDYLKQVQKLQQHIARGDIYEINYCIEFFAHTKINPVSEYIKLNAVSPNPFSAFLRYKDKYLVCASPERYLKKIDSTIISQPIKGTYPRGNNRIQDIQLKDRLSSDAKERNENIMIVDLVRNDLSRIAERKSVTVEELCGIYAFPQVYQMISTISARAAYYSVSDILKYTFPMGSMTGAPKIEAMKLIEKYEETRRGLYSGAVGYITPDNDFDFNVIIRSMLYNETNRYLSYMVGSAITSLSVPEKEYEECLLKASAIQKILNRQYQHA